MNELILAEKRLIHHVPRHQHEYWELYLCTGGQGVFTFNNLTLPCREGEILVIPPQTPHAHHSDDGAAHFCLSIRDTALPFRTPQLLADDENQSIRHLFADACYLFRQEAAGQALLSFYAQLICQHISRRRTPSQQSLLVEEIARSIAQNYTNPNYELDTLLRSAPYCYDYLCRLFRQEMRTTPHKYLADLRLQTAADILRTGGSSITEVARLCGHQDPLYFSRMFKKKYGCSPREYAKRTRSE